MKIALLSNVTAEVLAGLLRKEHAVWTPSGYGAWMQTALEPPADLKAFDPDLVCLLIDRRRGAPDASADDVGWAAARLRQAFPKAAVVTPDVERLAADLGDAFYDEKMWKLGRMPYSLLGLRRLSRLFVRHKVLAVDLDGTLWKGVVGEDGASGVVPDAGFQERLLELKRRGVLLVALSKNNPQDVEGVWRDARMRLSKSDFVSLAIGWNEKADELVRVARELNLGTDSFVFVDDSPAERARMRAARPEVAVADFPPQLDVFFPFAAASAEDAGRTEMYRAEGRRRDLAAEAGSLDDYLKALGIRNEIRLARPEDVPRLAQLSQKTNQFNVCTNRYSEGEIADFLADPRRLLFSVSSQDRFGDYGLVAFVQVRLTGEGSAEIVDWVMSCRAMNRRIEFSVQEEVERRLASVGVKNLEARWRRTSRNAPVADLYDRFGFACTLVSADERIYRKSRLKS